MAQRTFLTRLVLIATAAMLFACGEPTGACVTFNDVCNDDWAESECVSGMTFYEGQECADLGYTKACSEKYDCFCKPSDAFCP